MFHLGVMDHNFTWINSNTRFFLGFDGSKVLCIICYMLFSFFLLGWAIKELGGGFSSFCFVVFTPAWEMIRSLTMFIYIYIFVYTCSVIFPWVEATNSR